MIRHIFGLLVLTVLLGSCSRPGAKKPDFNGEELIHEAKYLSLKDCGDFLYAEVYAPWSDSLPLSRYMIADSLPADIEVPDGVTLIGKPLRRTIVSSSIYTSGLDELGLINTVAGVTDGNYYIPSDPIYSRLRGEAVTDIGSSMAPSIEKAVDLAPDGVVISPYEGGGLSDLEKIGVPVVLMTDYLEASPLGRAEWILLLGAAYGKLDEARAVYASVKERYEGLARRVAGAQPKPKVLSERPMSGVWYVPGGDSYVARMFADAGAVSPWSDQHVTGSIPLDEASVIDRAADADFWLVKNDKDLTAKALEAEFPHARAFKAYPEGVYFTNTLQKPYFNAIAYHPERVLADLVAIFHPELADSAYTLEFYEKLK